MNTTGTTGRGGRYPLHAEARAWLREQGPYGSEVVDYLTNAEACRDVDRYYPFGWAAFERDVRANRPVLCVKAVR